MKKLWIGLAVFFVVAGVAGMIADSTTTKKTAEEMRAYPVISRQELDTPLGSPYLAMLTALAIMVAREIARDESGSYNV